MGVGVGVGWGWGWGGGGGVGSIPGGGTKILHAVWCSQEKEDDNIHEMSATVETEFPVAFFLAFPLLSC